MNQAALELLIQLKDEASAGLHSIGDTLSSVGGMAVAGFAVAGAAVGGFLIESVKAAAEAQDAVSQLEATLTSTGGAAGMTSQELQDLAGSLQKTTKFGEETTIAAESILLTFTGIGKEVFPDATRTVLDMAQALGTDAKGAAMQLGKALNDPIAGMSALSRSGVSFTEEQKAAIKSMVEMGDVAGAQKLMLAELSKEFGGSAEAAGKTFSGQLVIAQNMLGEFGEMIGGKILPLITPLISKFITFATDALPKVEAALTPLIDGLSGVFNGLVYMTQALSGVDGEPLADAFQMIGEGIEKTFGIKIPKALWDSIFDFADDVEAVFDKVVGGLSDIAGGVVYMMQALSGVDGEPLADAFQMIGEGIEKVFGVKIPDTLWTSIFDFADTVETAFDKVVGFITTEFPKIQATISTVIGVIVSTVIPMLVQGFSNIVAIAQVVIASLIENWPKIQATIETVINAIVTNVLPIFIAVIGALQEISQKLVAWVIENWPLISATVTRVIQAIGNIIAVVLPIIRGIFETVFPIIKGVVETAMDLVLGIIKTVMQLINGNTEGALETLRETFAGVWDKIKNAAKLVWDQIKKVVTDAVQDAIDWVNGIGDKMKNIGANIILDIVAGIKSAPRSILNALREIVDAAIADIKRVLGIHSDSTVMMEIGQHMMGGLETGFIESMQAAVPRMQAAMSDLSTQMVMTPDGVKFSGDFGSGQRPSFASAGSVTVNIYGATVRSDTDIDELAYAVAKRVQKSRGR